MSKFHYPFKAPWIITRGFDVRLDIYLDGRHGAIDIITDKRPTTGEPILAIADGVCYPYPFLDKLSGYNCYVTHDDGWRSGYRHLRDLPHVAGAVRQGDVIGYADNTGLSTGPHLHFDLWNKTQQSPEAYLSSNGWWKHDPQVWLSKDQEDDMSQADVDAINAHTDKRFKELLEVHLADTEAKVAELHKQFIEWATDGNGAPSDGKYPNANFREEVLLRIREIDKGG